MAVRRSFCHFAGHDRKSRCFQATRIDTGIAAQLPAEWALSITGMRNSDSTLIDEVAMTKRYRLLAINAAMTPQENWMKREQQHDSFTINVDTGVAGLRGMLRTLLKDGYSFGNVVFTTHGNEGMIFFGNEVIRWNDWYNAEWYGAGFDRLFPDHNTEIYFAGCNVAAGANGWKFLEASVRTLGRTGGGGVAVGWTSAGFSWFPSGHAKHLSGSTREVMLVGGDSLQFFENCKRVDDGINRPT
jgi:hypothetical protein